MGSNSSFSASSSDEHGTSSEFSGEISPVREGNRKKDKETEKARGNYNQSDEEMITSSVPVDADVERVQLSLSNCSQESP